MLLNKGAVYKPISWHLDHCCLSRCPRSSVPRGLCRSGVLAARSTSAARIDRSIPWDRQGAHGFLFGEGGGEQLEATAPYQFREGEDDGSTLVPVKDYLSSRDGEKPLGVYAVYDSQRNIQYVNYSSNIVLAVKTHLSRVGDDRCALIRSMVFRNKSMATRMNLEEQATNWINEGGTIPPGNGVERELWEGDSVVDVNQMSAAEFAAYEEKRLKSSKENSGDEMRVESAASIAPWTASVQAVKGDICSDDAEQQLQETVKAEEGAPPSSSEGVPESSKQEVISPFTRAQVHRSIGSMDGAELMLTKNNVDRALEEVRPYLQADGGDVEVVGVENGVVSLRLQGACGTCPSSTATMKMGIERSLRAQFGDQLVDVVQVDQLDLSASVRSVNEHLDLLRPAVMNFGGSVDVVEVEDGVCKVKYVGPPPIAKGIEAAIKDRFPDLKVVEFL